VKRAAVALAGAALLVAFAALRLVEIRPRNLLDSNPFRRTLSPFDGAAFALLERCAGSIPPGASVAVEAPSRRPGDSAYCMLLARGLLPNRDVRVAGPPGGPDGWTPQFLIVLGSRQADVDGLLLLRTPEGTVWRLHE
jgi:hypothetical protein